MRIHYLSLLLLIAVASSLKAQTEKGRFLLGGFNMLELANLKNITEFQYSSSKESKEIVFSVTPIFGYFMIDNLSVGIIPHYRYKKSIDISSESSTRDISLSVHSRYYIGKKKLKPFTHLGIGYINRNVQYDFAFESGISSWNGNAPLYEAGLGLSYFITNCFSLDLLTMYSYNKTDMKWKGDSRFSSTYDNVLTSKDLELNLSFLFYFGRSGKTESE